MHAHAPRLSWFAWAFAFARGALKAADMPSGQATAEYLDGAAALCLDRALCGDAFNGRLVPLPVRPPAPPHLDFLHSFHRGFPVEPETLADLELRGLVLGGKVTAKGKAECALAGVLLLAPRGSSKPGPTSEEDERADVPPEKVLSRFQRQLVARGLWAPTPEPPRVVYALAPPPEPEPELPAEAPPRRARRGARGAGRTKPSLDKPADEIRAANKLRAAAYRERQRALRPPKELKEPKERNCIPVNPTKRPENFAELVRLLLLDGYRHTRDKRCAKEMRLFNELERRLKVSRATLYVWTKGMSLTLDEDQKKSLVGG